MNVNNNSNLFTDNTNNVFIDSTNNINNISSFNTSMNNENNITRNVVLIDKEFDSEEDYSIYKKNKLIYFFTNKKILTIIFVLIFIFVCIVVYKAFYYGKKVDHYEEFFTTIESKDEEYAIVYDDKNMDNETLKKVAASELVNCINSKIDEEKLPDSIKSIIDEINNYYNQSNDYFSFFIYKESAF